jgi:hypothetical protein
MSEQEDTPGPLFAGVYFLDRRGPKKNLKSKKPISLTNPSVCPLESLFGGKERVRCFKRNCFQKRPGVFRPGKSIRAARISELSDLLFSLDIGTYLENTASERIHVWLKNPSKVFV